MGKGNWLTEYLTNDAKPIYRVTEIEIVCIAHRKTAVESGHICKNTAPKTRNNCRHT